MIAGRSSGDGWKGGSWWFHWGVGLSVEGRRVGGGGFIWARQVIVMEWIGYVEIEIRVGGVVVKGIGMWRSCGDRVVVSS